MLSLGCTQEYPVMCGDGECYKDYSFCGALDGCTDPEHPIMCPLGGCANDFDECINKVYDCPLEEEERCGDGMCRENCDGIATNGCASEAPIYCQNGTCVKFLSQCFDFRCSLDRPILCSNLTCQDSMDSCPQNVMSTMIEDTVSEILARNISTIMEVVDVASRADGNEIKLALKVERRNLYFPWYTAGYQINDEKSIDSVEVEVEATAVPMSDLRETKLRYLNMNLQMETFANRIFTRNLSSLMPQMFLRSFAFELKINNLGYNSLLFAGPIEAIFKYNIINGYPDMSLLAVEDDEDDEPGRPGDEKKVDPIDEMYPEDQPDRIYCLGMLNPVSNLWKCVNRTIKEITEESITYDIPTPGIYAVLFFPIGGSEDEGPCGWLCQNKKAVTTFFIFYLPLVLLFGSYLFMVANNMWSEAKKTMKKFEDQVKAKLLAQKEDEAFNKPQTEEIPDEETESDEKDKLDQMKFMDKIKQDKCDVDKIRDILNEDNYEVKGDTMTFINPLVFNKLNEDKAEQEVIEKEKEKIEKKYVGEDLLTKKLKQLNKMSMLKEEIIHLQNEIQRLKSLQGNNDLVAEEDIERDGPMDDRYDTYATGRQPQGRFEGHGSQLDDLHSEDPNTDPTPDYGSDQS